MKSFIATIAILGLVGLMVGASLSFAAESSITATVKVQQVALSITDGEIDYGTLDLSGTKDTTASGVDDTQTVQNTGNVNEDFDVKGTNVSGTCTWTLDSTQGTDHYFHKICTSNCDSSPTWTALTTTYTEYATNIAPLGTADFDFQVGVPSSTSCSSQVNVNIWVQASAH
jgi:hypothetical protein